MDILGLLNWRYATKRMTGKKIPQEKTEVILESIRLSASSIGLQPCRVIVIEDPKLLEQIKPIATIRLRLLKHRTFWCLPPGPM